MAQITEDIRYQVPQDLDLAAYARFACDRVTWAIGMATRRYIFIGDTHNSVFDARFKAAVADHCTTGGRLQNVIVIAERSIFASTPHLPLRANVIQEANTQASPFDPQRDVDVVRQIATQVAREPAFGVTRPVVIFFGQAHETGLRQQMEAQLPGTDRICWWSFRSLDDQVAALPDLNAGWRFPIQPGFDFVGFCTLANHLDETLAEVSIVEKGHRPIARRHFPIQLLHPGTVGQRAATHAVFDPAGRTSIMREVLEASAIGQIRVTATDRTRFIPVSPGNYQVLVARGLAL